MLEYNNFGRNVCQRYTKDNGVLLDVGAKGGGEAQGGDGEEEEAFALPHVERKRPNVHVRTVYTCMLVHTPK